MRPADVRAASRIATRKGLTINDTEKLRELARIVAFHRMTNQLSKQRKI